ncbi:MAG: hypothetical protein ACREJG_02050 [Candidatus Rokuibacteriota bacterium]
MNRLSLAQGLYFLVTGLWSLVSIRTFFAVTGPKTDVWLVKTVGVLVAVIGAVLMAAGMRRHTPPELPLLAAGSAAGLAGIDTVYVARRRISPIYLLDAVVEAALVTCWIYLAATSAELRPGAPRRPRRISKRGG